MSKLLHCTLLLSLLILLSPASFAQTEAEIKALEKDLSNRFGLEKLATLNQLTSFYSESNTRKAVRYGRQAAVLSESVFTADNVLTQPEDRMLKLQAHSILGDLYLGQEKYAKAQTQWEKALSEAELLGDSIAQVRLDNQLRDIAGKVKERGILGKTIKPLKLNEKIAGSTANLKLSSVIALAKKSEQLKQYSRAIEQYEKAINLSRNVGDAEQIARLQVKIAALYQLQGKTESAAAYYQMSAKTFDKLQDTTAMKSSQEALEQVVKDVIAMRPVMSFDTMGTDEELMKSMANFERLANESRNRQDVEQYIQYYEKYQNLRLSFLERKKQREIDSIRLLSQSTELMLLAQENELNEVELVQRAEELRRQAQFRNGLIAGVLVLLMLAAVFWWLFTSKRKAHKDLSITYDRLDETRKQLVAAELNVKKLLGQQVSQDIAEALIGEEAVGQHVQKYVCIMFLDIRDFTPFASSRTPAEVIAYQNDVFGFMIEIVTRYHGVINQFMGDGFMATFGAPVSYDSDVRNAYQAAVEIVKEVNERSASAAIPSTRIGIGLHAGEVVAGNVGTDVRKQYSITGTTVITAARIEQLNKQYASQLLISETVADELGDDELKESEVFETKLKGMEHPIKVYKVM